MDCTLASMDSDQCSLGFFGVYPRFRHITMFFSILNHHWQRHETSPQEHCSNIPPVAVPQHPWILYPNIYYISCNSHQEHSLVNVLLEHYPIKRCCFDLQRIIVQVMFKNPQNSADIYQPMGLSENRVPHPLDNHH